MIKDSLFYMANAHPEIGRLFDFYDAGKLEAAENAQKRTLLIMDTILTFPDLSSAGLQEWKQIKGYILEYKTLDGYQKSVLKRYAEPFAHKFMNSYSG